MRQGQSRSGGWLTVRIARPGLLGTPGLAFLFVASAVWRRPPASAARQRAPGRRGVKMSHEGLFATEHTNQVKSPNLSAFQLVGDICKSSGGPIQATGLFVCLNCTRRQG